MKKFVQTAIIATMILSICNNAKATIRRLGFPGAGITGVDYNTLQSVVDASLANDTIYVFPGSWGYANLSRRAVFLSFGIDNGNVGLQNITGYAYIGLRLYAGSDSSIFEGVSVLALTPLDAVKNIIVRRCGVTIDLYNKTFENWVISQCTSINNRFLYGGDGGNIKNWLIENSFIDYFGVEGNILGGSSATLNNNIFYQAPINFGLNPFQLRNNIFVDCGNINGSNGIPKYYNNVSTNANIPTGNGNVLNVPNFNIFVGYPVQGSYSNDARFAIRNDSPAKTAGEGGKEVGIFGGNSPFKLNAIPAIPAFFQLSAPSGTASSNPYTITFSVRSNN